MGSSLRVGWPHGLQICMLIGLFNICGVGVCRGGGPLTPHIIFFFPSIYKLSFKFF